MSKVRVYELAKDVGVENKQLIEFLQGLGASVKNHMSTVEAEVAHKARSHFKDAAAGKTQAASSNGNSLTAAPARKDSPAPRAAQPKESAPAKPTTDKGARTASSGEGGPDRGRAGAARPGTGGGRPGPTKPQAGGRPTQRGAQRGGPADRRGRRPGQGAQTAPVQVAERPSSSSKPVARPEPGSRGKLEIPESIVIKDLAGKVGVAATAIIKFLMKNGLMASINQAVDYDTAAKVATRLGYEVVRPKDPVETWTEDMEDPPGSLKPRPPVVTILGHVDHGKTTLLDAIREAKVVEKEAGGITQHIGAYQVELDDGDQITFLDTPGHEAFTAMRSRGAQVTDLAILVVAADDGVMPQTVEAINHAQAAQVPIIVAINKMDRPNANPDHVKQGLTAHGLVPEEWGGDTVCVAVSALNKEGLDDLLEMISLVAEMRELKANPDRLARGIVVEAELDRGRGPVATVLVQKGTLKIGDAVVTGSAAGKVRAMFDHAGRSIQEAGPSAPVVVLGFSEVPAAGDLMVAVPEDRIARQVAGQRTQERQAERHNAPRATLTDLFSRIKEGELKDLNVILKGDVQGSVEALRQSLEKLTNEEVRVNVIHSGVGAITETDVNLAAASDAIIIGFSVRPDPTARKAAEREKVAIHMYRVIYEAIDDIKAAMLGMLDPVYQEVVLGRAEVRATFKVPNAGVVAGCHVVDGRILRSAQARIVRDGTVVHEGEIGSLKRFKDDVREVAEGYECGIGLERFNDVKEGDVIEAFTMEEVKPTAPA